MSGKILRSEMRGESLFLILNEKPVQMMMRAEMRGESLFLIISGQATTSTDPAYTGQPTAVAAAEPQGSSPELEPAFAFSGIAPEATTEEQGPPLESLSPSSDSSKSTEISRHGMVTRTRSGKISRKPQQSLESNSNEASTVSRVNRRSRSRAQAKATVIATRKATAKQKKIKLKNSRKPPSSAAPAPPNASLGDVTVKVRVSDDNQLGIGQIPVASATANSAQTAGTSLVPPTNDEFAAARALLYLKHPDMPNPQQPGYEATKVQQWADWVTDQIDLAEISTFDLEQIQGWVYRETLSDGDSEATSDSASTAGSDLDAEWAAAPSRANTTI
ncbi:hypothetical protein ABW21_db0207500 [Orbilia brochopaga]|nr:hypothetical protein ABW21_db0207500 [Drechslerella brochopaga]